MSNRGKVVVGLGLVAMLAMPVAPSGAGEEENGDKKEPSIDALIWISETCSAEKVTPDPIRAWSSNVIRWGITSECGHEANISISIEIPSSEIDPIDPKYPHMNKQTTKAKDKPGLPIVVKVKSKDALGALGMKEGEVREYKYVVDVDGHVLDPELEIHR